MSINLTTTQNNYVKNFPQNTPLKAAQGFIVTSLIHLTAGVAGKAAFLGGAVSATATLIEAVTRPIIETIFPKDSIITTCVQLVLAVTLTTTLATAMVPWVGVAHKMTSSSIPILAFIVLNSNAHENEALAIVL